MIFNKNKEGGFRIIPIYIYIYINLYRVIILLIFSHKRFLSFISQIRGVLRKPLSFFRKTKLSKMALLPLEEVEKNIDNETNASNEVRNFFSNHQFFSIK